MVQWILSSLKLRVIRLEGLILTATQLGHLDVAQCLHEQLQKQREVSACIRSPGVTPFARAALRGAILSGHLELAKFHVDQGYQLGSTLCWKVPYAVVSDNLVMMKWLRSHQLAGDTTVWLNGAASAGHLDIVKWIHKHIPEVAVIKEAMDGAAENGHLEMVQWLQENRKEDCAERWTIDDAAWSDHLAVVQHFTRFERYIVQHMRWTQLLRMGTSRSSSGCTRTARRRGWTRTTRGSGYTR